MHRLVKSLESIGLSQIYTTDYGFDALEHIIRHNCKVCLLDKDLKGLNAWDISNAARFKGIPSKFIILGADSDSSLKTNRNVLAKVDLSDETALLKILALVQRESNTLKIRHIKSH